MNEINLTFVLVSAIAGILVGLPAGMAGALALIARLNASKETKDSAEQLLSRGVPPETVSEINMIANRSLQLMEGVFSAIREGAIFVRDITDGKPNNMPEATTPAQEVNPRANR